jgi:lipopolysaccharide/colanic/teichoic acid biosynthesis glycosyltransferase
MSECLVTVKDEISTRDDAVLLRVAPDRNDPTNRTLLEDLDRRFSTRNGSRQFLRARVRYYRKKQMWAVVINSARFLKRVVDVSVSAVALILLAPLFAAVAVAIRLTDHGPVIFWQKRVGKWGHEFDFPKFRSMVTNAEELKKQLLTQNDHEGGSVTFKMKRDPRITWIGRIIRKLSIDELPQLCCVLKGEMSLVGPRPPVPMEVAEYSLEDRRRLEATPGLTCIWQVSGRGDIPFDEQVQLDVQYIESQSLWFDIKLLFQTVPAVLPGKGAY